MCNLPIKYALQVNNTYLYNEVCATFVAFATKNTKLFLVKSTFRKTRYKKYSTNATL